MKKILYIVMLSFLFVADGFCQPKEISVASIYKYQENKFLVKQDSLIRVYNDPLIEIHRFYIAIDKAFFDSASKGIRLQGRICFIKDSSNCVGLPGVGVYKARKMDDNVLTNWVQIGESSHDTNTYEKDGFFDVQFKIEKEESLFLFMPYFYLEEFKLGELLNEKSAINKKLGIKNRHCR